MIAALYSPLLGSAPPDAPPQSLIAGFPFYDSVGGRSQSLDTELERFLDAGPPPLVFSLGSFGVAAAGDFYSTAVAASTALRMRAVLFVGDEASGRFKCLASSAIFIAAYAPHSLIFPHAAAIIRHGGIGTVGQAMRAGRPQLVCPMLGDQADNAERLIRLGIARRLDHRHFTESRAIAALRSLQGDETVVKAAHDVALTVAIEDGARISAQGIEALLERNRGRA